MVVAGTSAGTMSIWDPERVETYLNFAATFVAGTSAGTMLFKPRSSGYMGPTAG